MKTIELTVEVTGQEVKQSLETSGFTGGECLKASAPFEKIGGAVVQEQMTAEGHGAACQFVPAAE